MPYYDTLAADVARAKAILAKGAPCQYRPDHNGECLDCDEPAEVHLMRHVGGGGVIYGADVYAAYKLLESFVAAIEAVGPKVCELALRHEQRANAVPDCLCRTRGCGHLASLHTGVQGACTVEGCECGPGGWS